MDRQITHTGQLIPNATLLGGEKAKLFAIGHALESVFGGSTCVSGLACTPTSPASLQVVVGAGSIMAKAAIDGTNAFGDLGIDSTPVVKQGLLLQPLTLPALTPPVASGYSQVFLVQAIQSDQDSGTVLPYYNAANPAQPFNGPNNSGNSDVTLRTSACVIAIKPGIAASSGTQQAPAPDVGYTGLYAITLTNGQTQITSANIAVYPGAPFIPVKLPQVPAVVQSGQWVYAVDTGSAGALAAALNPVPAALPDGMEVRVKAANAAAGGDTFNPNGLGALPIVRRGGAVPVAGDWAANDIIALRKRGSSWQLAGIVPSDVSVVINTFQIAGGRYATLSGSGTWTVPANAAPVIRILMNGGGAGGGGSFTGGSFQAAGVGGGGGEYAEGTFAVTPGQQFAYSVGGGGAGGAGSSTPTPGQNGGTTSFGGLISAVGGTGGSAGLNGISSGGGTGGTGGTGGGRRQAGGGGGFGIVTSTTGTQGGQGGYSPFGGPGTSPNVNANGSLGYGPGGGGAGGAATSASQSGNGAGGSNGGNGAAGTIVIQY